MTTSNRPSFRIISTVVLLGIWACVGEEDLEQPVEEFDGAVSQLGEIDANEPEAEEVSYDELRADFNGDGFADLAIGLPGDDASGTDSGSVIVIYGSEDGLDANGELDAQIFWAGKGNIPSNANDSGDRFGHAVAAGHFNDDQYADLAIGAPGDSNDAGLVTVLLGSENGLTDIGSDVWIRGSGIAGINLSDDEFGFALATGDFDGNGFDDLAVGAPGVDRSGQEDAGAVNVIYGTAAGLSVTGNEQLAQGLGGVDGSPNEGDRFGFALAAGNLDGDDEDDLAIGVPGEISSQGIVQVLYGSGSGLLSVSLQQTWSQTGAIRDEPANGDQFGYALAIGNFNGDTDDFDDLAIGVPFENRAGAADAGAVNVIYGSNTGLTTTGNQIFDQDAGVEGLAEPNDHFGRALTAGDFDGDENDDLAIGVPDEDLDATEDAGWVNVLYGSANRLTDVDDQKWNQNIGTIIGFGEENDFFGAAVSAGDFNGDGAADLAVGVPDEDIGDDDVNAGWIHAIYGDVGDGLTDAGNQVWHQDIGDVPLDADNNDRFGFSVR